MGEAMATPGWYPDPYDRNIEAYWDGFRWADRRWRRGNDAPVVDIVIVGAVLIFLMMIVGLEILKPWQSQEEKACIAGYQSERSQERNVPQSTVHEYCGAIYG